MYQKKEKKFLQKKKEPSFVTVKGCDGTQELL